MIGIISGVIALLATFIGFVIRFNSLNSKSDLGQAFFTDEQKLKVYYYRLFILSFIIFIEAFCIIMLILISADDSTGVIDFTQFVIVLIISIGISLLSFLLMGKIFKIIQNFGIKDHYKFKIDLPEIGYLYIIRMYNTDICICSKDPDAGFKENSEQTYLIPLQDIMNKELIKTKWPVPEKSLFQKIFN